MTAKDGGAGMDREFSIYGPMICGSEEAENRIYKVLLGKSGKRWFVANQLNPADNVYVEGGRNSDGFGGRTLNFRTESGEIIALKGPWHSNSKGLYDDTGYDIRAKSLTQGICALDRKRGYPEPELYIGVLYFDECPVLGEYERIEKLAQTLADEHGKKICYAMKSMGGGVSSWTNPKQDNVPNRRISEDSAHAKGGGE